MFEIALLEFTCVVASSFNTDSGEMAPYVQKAKCGVVIIQQKLVIPCGRDFFLCFVGNQRRKYPSTDWVI
jgi:hypothetical protein